ncbi:DUF6268 family outer membrane beta-barrel protein [Rapidithrix thailandica]|uniref:DUF6268 family outer membrane beta-barrel protein n=1 Tax=Rapidithrix thailandica TaxID=413964 RepID=A0AAW9S576_9BACT
MKKQLLVLLILTSCHIGYAQFEDGFQVSNTMFPENAKVDIFKSQISLQKSLRVSDKGAAVIVGGSYMFSKFDFDRYKSPYSFSSLENFHSASVKLGYTRALGKNLRFLALTEPMFSSNLDDELKIRDFSIIGIVVFTLSNKHKNSFFNFGLVYDSQLGFPVGVLNFQRIVNKKWSFRLGAPSFNLAYNLNERNTLQPFAKLDWFYGNVSRSVLSSLGDTKSRLSHIALLGGMAYIHKMGKHISLSVEGGYSLVNELDILNYEIDDNELLDFDMRNNLYLKLEVRYKFLRSKPPVHKRM